MIYELFKEEHLDFRYIPPSFIKSIITKKQYEYSVIGKSFENRDIDLLSVGTGPIRILLWSQMHGNETTATRSMMDIWKFLHSQHLLAVELRNNLTIDYIPQLNPDGAQYYTRRNGANIDLNRDFISSASTELPYLKQQVNKFDYNYLFNLHDQRSIFHPKGSIEPATLSFLAPSIGSNSEVNNAMHVSKQLIGSIFNEMKSMIPNGIARFNNEYYPKSTGDNFQKLNIPTILIESGHYSNDYDRNKTREYTFNAILIGLINISKNLHSNQSLEDYENIPPNENKAFDIIFTKVKIANQYHESIVDIGLNYREQLENEKINFIAVIQNIGDLSDCFGYKEYNSNNQLFNNIKERHRKHIPLPNETADFNIGTIMFKDGILYSKK